MVQCIIHGINEDFSCLEVTSFLETCEDNFGIKYQGKFKDDDTHKGNNNKTSQPSEIKLKISAKWEE